MAKVGHYGPFGLLQVLVFPDRGQYGPFGLLQFFVTPNRGQYGPFGLLQFCVMHTRAQHWPFSLSLRDQSAILTANSRVHRLLTFDTRGLFSIAWEFLRVAP